MKNKLLLLLSAFFAFTSSTLAQPVSGPRVSTNRSIAVFESVNGKLIGSSGANVDTNGNLWFGGPGTLIVKSLTQAQRDAMTPTNGMVVYNTTTATTQRYQGGAWGDFAGGSGEVNTASNVGTGYHWFDAKVGFDLPFNTFTNNATITITSNANLFTFSRPAISGVISIPAGTNVATMTPNSITLTTDTIGNYVGSVADGTGIDGTASGEGAIYTPTLDLTEINSVTFGDGSQASFTHTFNVSTGTDPVWTFGNGTMNLSAGTLQQGGTPVVISTRALTIAGTTGQITSSAAAQDLSADRTWTLSIPAAFDLGTNTSFEMPNGATPTVSVFGQIAGDNDIWGAGRGAPVFFDGTATVILVGALASDTPVNGQVLKFNTGGTFTWENDSTGGSGSVYVNAASISDPNFQNSSNILWVVDASTNLLGVVTNVSSSQIIDGTIVDADINSITTRSKLPSAIAYEDEANVFTALQTIMGSLSVTNAITAQTITATNALAGGTITEGGNAVPNSTDHLGFFAATTSAQLAGVLSNESGTGAAVFSSDATTTNLTLITPKDAIFTNLTATVFLSANADPADAGVIRLGNAEIIAWESSPAGTDITLSVDASEIMQASGTFNAVTLTESANAVPNATDHLGFFAATTSAQFLGVINNETGTGAVVASSDATTTNLTLITPKDSTWTNITVNGRITLNGDVVVAQTSGTTVDWSSTGDSVVTNQATGDFTWTFSGTQVTGARRTLVIDNAAATNITVTIPPYLDMCTGQSGVTTYTVLGSGYHSLHLYYDGTVYRRLCEKDNPLLANLGTLYGTSSNGIPILYAGSNWYFLSTNASSGKMIYTTNEPPFFVIGDAPAGASADNVLINATDVTDALGVSFTNTVASSTVASTTWTINSGTTPDLATLVIGTASSSVAGIVTAAAQSLGGEKIFPGGVTTTNSSFFVSASGGAADESTFGIDATSTGFFRILNYDDTRASGIVFFSAEDTGSGNSAPQFHFPVLFNNGATGPGSVRLLEDSDNGTSYVEVIAPASLAGNQTLTLPDATDTLVGKATTDTLTNKNLDGEGTGNVILNMQYFYPKLARVTSGITGATNDWSANGFGEPIWSGAVDTNDYVLYKTDVPTDVLTSVEFVLDTFKLVGGGTDADVVEMRFGMATVADSAPAYPTTFSNYCVFQFTPSSPAANDLLVAVTSGTLTNWAAATAGQKAMYIQVQRANNSNDDAMTAWNEPRIRFKNSR